MVFRLISIFILVLLISSCYNVGMTRCGNFRQMKKNHNSFSFENCPRLINDSTGLPLGNITFYKNRTYSPDKQYYIQSNRLFKEFKFKRVKIKNAETDKRICKVKLNPYHAAIVWGKDALVGIEHEYFGVRSITLIEFKNSKQIRYSTRGYLSQVGSDRLNSYFETNNLLMKHDQDSMFFRHSIISFNQNKIQEIEALEQVKSGDTSKNYVFYSPVYKMGKTEFLNEQYKSITTSIINEIDNSAFVFTDSTLLANIQEPVFHDNHFYWNIYGKDEFKLIKFSNDTILDVFDFNKVLDLHRVFDYKFENQYLVFTCYPTFKLLKTKSKSELKRESLLKIGFYNLNTKELFYSKITK